MRLDSTLKKRVILSDTLAQSELYKLCFNMLINVAGRYAKNDEDKQAIVNSAFIKIINNIGNYVEKDTFQSWVKCIATNVGIDSYRRRKAYKDFFNQDYDFEICYSKEHPEIEYKHSEEELIDMVNRLPKATKAVFNLFNNGLPHKQICKILKISSETSKWHMKEARKKLKLSLKHT